MVEQEGLGSGREFSRDGNRELTRDNGAATGYIVFNAESLEEAEKLAGECPIVSSNVVLEIMAKEDCG